MNRNPDEILDELLVLQVQSGEQAALSRLVSRWQSRLVLRARQITGRRDVAEDIVQEGWIAIIRGIRRLDDPAVFRSWAYRIIHNKSVDWVRSQVRRRELADSLSAETTHAPLPDNGTDRSQKARLAEAGLEDLRDAIRQLSSEQQVLLRMYYSDRMSLKEIAFTTGVATGTLKYRLFKMRQQLKSIIERSST